MGKIPHLAQKIKGKIPHLPNLQCIGSKRDPGIAIPKRSWEKAMTIVPEITSVDGVARHSQIIRLPAPPSLLVDNNCRRAGTKQLGARGEAQGIRWYGGLHGQNSARGKFRTSPRKVRGKFRTKLKYGIFPAEKSPRGIPPPPVRRRCMQHRLDNLTALLIPLVLLSPGGSDCLLDLIPEDETDWCCWGVKLRAGLS